MRFGGHETFAVREDWLPKGLMLLNEKQDAFSNPFVSDELGVGRNMAKSIQFWMVATGLIEKDSRGSVPQITSLGRTIQQHDEYFLHIATWWALHLNLVTKEDKAVAWHWFFNHFSTDRFDRWQCSQEFQKYVTYAIGRRTAPATLKRDIACLLASYATPVPPQNSDPEEGSESPFRALDMVVQHCESDTYRLNRRKKSIPNEILGYALTAMTSSDDEDGYCQIRFSDALSKPNGPGRTLALDSDSLIELLSQAEVALGEKTLHLDNSGGERFIRVKSLKPSEWLKHCYTRKVQ